MVGDPLEPLWLPVFTHPLVDPIGHSNNLGLKLNYIINILFSYLEKFTPSSTLRHGSGADSQSHQRRFPWDKVALVNISKTLEDIPKPFKNGLSWIVLHCL